MQWYSVIPAQARIHAGTVTQHQVMDSRLRGNDETGMPFPAPYSPLRSGIIMDVNPPTDPQSVQPPADDGPSAFEQMFEHAPDAIFVESTDGDVIDVNEQACELHGMTRDELLGKHVLDLVPPEQRSVVQKEFPRFAKGSMKMYEGQSLHKSGRCIPVELITSQITYKGQPALLIHVRDLSTRKALHQSDALNQAILQTLPGGILRLDAKRRIVFANDQAIQFFCLEHDADQQCYHWSENCQLLHEDGTALDMQTHWPGYRCMDDLKRQEAVTLGLLCQHGPQSWAVFSATPVVDRRTRICQGAVVSFVDTTKLRSTMLALRESEYRFHLAFDHAPMGMVLASPEGKFLQINNRFCQMLGYHWSELIKLSFPEIANPQDHELCAVFATKTFTSKATRHSTRKCYVHRDGHDVWCQLTITVIRNDDGEPMYCLSQIEDLTPQLKAQAQREQLEQRLRQAQKLQAIGTLASGVAHDFNNMLLAIESYLDMAQTQYQRGQDPTRAIQNIRQAITQSTGMTRSLLTFARQTRGAKQSLDMAQLVEQSVTTLKPLIPASINVVIDNQIKTPLHIDADASQIQQLLMNLVVNARDAMPQGGTLTLKLQSQRAEGRRPLLDLSVCDTGVGMDKKTRHRLFDPFFTTKSRGQGTGLGLAVVHGIVIDHHAQITVQSELGTGTCFKITFPVNHSHNHGQPDEVGHATGPFHVMLLQGDPILHQVLDTLLSEHDIHLDGLPDARSLTCHLQDNPQQTYDLLVCDEHPDSQPDEALVNELLNRQPRFKWVLMTTTDKPSQPARHVTQAVRLKQPMSVRELAQHLLDILEAPAGNSSLNLP